MSHDEPPVSETPAVVQWVYRIVNGLFTFGILGLIAVLMRASFSAKSPNDAVAYAFANLFVFAMMTAGLLVLVLLVHAVESRSVRYLKWPFLLFTLTYLVMTTGNDLVLPRLTGSDTVRLRVVNAAGETIEHVEFHGRGAYRALRRLPSGTATVTTFRGREINFQAGDPYSNCVSVAWNAGGRRRDRVIVDRSRVIGDSMIVHFHAPDSMTVAVW